MEESQQAMVEQLKSKNIKRDVDVVELYMGEKSLKKVTDLGRFQNLKYLWLNNNKLHRISCLSCNYCISELYLQHNDLVTVTGAIQHLTSLSVLFLNNNQLENLEKVVQELRNMQGLKVLNLFNNPAAQESEYRSFVVFCLPSVELLDRSEVKKCERDQASKMYDQVNQEVADKIAFGRRSEGPPALHYPGASKLQSTVPANFEVGNNFYRNNPPYANEDQAVKIRHMRRSIMEYSSFDWTKVPRAQERRTTEEPFTRPQIVTTRFR